MKCAGVTGAAVVALGAVGVADAWSALGARASGSRRRRVLASPNFRDGRFVNSLPNDEKVWLALRNWAKGGQNQRPEVPIPVVQPDPSVLARTPDSGLRLTWLGHSCLLIDLGGRRFLTDPVWSRRAAPSRFIGVERFFPPLLALGELPPLDAVLLSHDHYDHLDEATIRWFARGETPFIAPLGVGAHLEHWGVAAERITELDWWESTRRQGVELTCTPARHFSGRTLRDRDATLWSGWALAGAEHRVYYSGDTAMFPELAEIGQKLGPFDAAMVEIGAYNQAWADVHLGPEQAVEAHLMARGGLLLPTHWGTYNLAVHGWTEPVERLLVEAGRRGVTAVIPRPGESVEPAAPPELKRWWPSLPYESAEDAPVVSSGLGRTSVSPQG